MDFFFLNNNKKYIVNNKPRIIFTWLLTKILQNNTYYHRTYHIRFKNF